MADRRRAVATAGVGYTLVGTGGVLRGHAIDAAHGAIGRDTRRMVPPSRAVLRARQLHLPAARTLTRRWGAGTALVTLGAPAAAEGTLDLFRHRRTTPVIKRRTLLGEGVAGTGDAWKDKAEGFQSGAPLRIRAIPIAVGATAAAGGSVAAHRALDLIARRRRVSGRLRSGLTAVAAVPAVVGSLPLSRRLTRRAGYQPQAAGGLRPIEKTQWMGGDYHPAASFYGRDPLWGDSSRQRRMMAQRQHLENQRLNRASDAASRKRWHQPPPALETRGPRAWVGERRTEQEVHGPALRSSANKRVSYDPSVGRYNRTRLDQQVARHPLRRPVTVAITHRADLARGQVFMGSRRDQPRVELSRHLWDHSPGRNGRKLRSHVLHHELAHANRTGSVHRPQLAPVGAFMTHEPGLREEGRADAIAAAHSPFRRNTYSGLLHWGKNPFLETKTSVVGRLGRVRKVSTVYRGPDYLGRHVSPRQQRLRIYAAGGTPIVGPLAQARQAGKYAPPGHRNSAIARQLVGGPGAGAVGGVGAAYGLAHLAEYSPTIARHTERAAQAGSDVKTKAFGAFGIRRAPKAPGEVPAVLRRVASTKLGAPLFSSKRRAIGAGVGYVAGKTIAGQVGGNIAINRNIAAQRRHDAHRMRTPIIKLDSGLTDRQAHTLARRKHRSAVMSVIGGTAGLTALGLHGARRLPRYRDSEAKLARWRESALVVGAGIGGANALTNAAIQRRESKAITAAVAKTWWSKRANTPMRTSLTDTEAHKLVHGRGGYGLTGPLPGHLDRPARMQAYEARYLAAGGRKAEHWQHRAQHAEVARNVGVASATGAGAAWLAASSPRVRRAVSPLSRLVARRGLNEGRVKHATERLAAAGGTLAGAAELSEEYARHRRGSYTSAPAGVAASALRRMQSYSPQ